MGSLFGGRSAFEEAEKQNKGGFGGKRVIIPEFYLKEGESKEVVFCDDTPEVVNGHKGMIDAFRAPRWFTCSAGAHPCIFCEKNFFRTWVGPMTVLVDAWTDAKSGQVFKWTKRVLMAGKETLLKLKLKKENRQKAGDPGLVGGLFSISRITKRNAIDDCEFMKRVTPTDLGVPDFKPLDYAALLVTRTREDMDDLFNRHQVRDVFKKNAPQAPAPVAAAQPSGGRPAAPANDEEVEY